MRILIHLILHILVPATVARLAFPSYWRRAWLIMMLTMAVDIDHLVAEPIFDPQRCSIGFHPLHTYPAMLGYALMLAIPRLRLPAYGLIIHMILDGIDCFWMRRL